MRKIILVFAFLAISCGFYSLAGSIPPHIKSISIPLVENQTSDFGLSENLTDQIILQFNESGILSIQNADEAHSILKGTIKKLPMAPIATTKMNQYLNIGIKLM